MRRVLPLVLALTALLLPAGAVPAAAAGPATTVSGGHAQPWGLALLPDGSALFTERDTRRMWLARPGQPARHVYTVSEATARGEGGLLGIALSPDFARDRRVYLYFTTSTDNRIASMVLGSQARPRVLLTGIPAGARPRRRAPAVRARRDALRRHRGRRRAVACAGPGQPRGQGAADDA